MDTYHEEDGAIWPHPLKITERHGDYRREWFVIQTMYGLAHASTYFENNRNIDRTCIEFIHLGRMYERSWLRVWGDKTITRLANEFVRDVVRKKA